MYHRACFAGHNKWVPGERRSPRTTSGWGIRAILTGLAEPKHLADAVPAWRRQRLLLDASRHAIFRRSDRPSVSAPLLDTGRDPRTMERGALP